ncbi:unnamed protein product [Symbiodinium sp. CCMP2456]|nr:unnamed protein product [Symbiodinium sp. CCMP2456]
MDAAGAADAQAFRYLSAEFSQQGWPEEVWQRNWNGQPPTWGPQIPTYGGPSLNYMTQDGAATSSQFPGQPHGGDQSGGQAGQAEPSQFFPAGVPGGLDPPGSPFDPWRDAARQLIAAATQGTGPPPATATSSGGGVGLGNVIDGGSGSAAALRSPGLMRPEDTERLLIYPQDYLFLHMHLHYQVTGFLPEQFPLFQELQYLREDIMEPPEFYLTEGDFSDPPAWPGWTYRKQWEVALRRWDKQTDVPVFRRAEKILRSLGWEMQVDFEHLTEDALTAPGYLDLILGVMSMKAGVRDDDEKRQTFRNVIHGSTRRKDETLGQFANRRIRDFTKAASYGILLPDEFKVALLREGAGLSDQNLQNLTVMTQGREADVDHLAATLARLDVRGDRLSGAVFHEAPEDDSYLAQEDEDDEEAEGSDDESLPDDLVLAELEDLSFTEEQAKMVFAMMESRAPRKRRTWKENKLFKAEARKDRRSFQKGFHHPPGGRSGAGHSGSGPRPGHRGDRPRRSIAELKRMSTCRLCGKKGHWAEDCDGSRPTGSADPPKASGFCYLGPADGGRSLFSGISMSELGGIMQAAKQIFPRQPIADSMSFLTLESGTAILDIGATQDLIGAPALESLDKALKASGLRYIEVPAPEGAPTGIGGAARVTKAVLVPISPGGIPGIVHFVVIEGNVPPLLSVGLLEYLGASFSLVNDQVTFEKIGVTRKMTREPSGHRTIPLVEWPGGFFPIPTEVREKYKLPKGMCCPVDWCISEIREQIVLMRVFFLKLSVMNMHAVNMSPNPLNTHMSPNPTGVLLNIRVIQKLLILKIRCTPIRTRPSQVDPPPRDMERTRAELTLQRWRALVNRTFFLLETTRMVYVRLIMAERGQKAVTTDKKKYLEADNQVPGRCLHAGRHINRGNQYASWQVCANCNARLNYASRNRMKAKPKAKATATNPGYSAGMPGSSSGLAVNLAENRDSSRARQSKMTQGPMAPEGSPEVASALQMMALGFREMNATMAELTRGQNRMIMMMAAAQNPVQNFTEMTMEEIRTAAVQAAAVPMEVSGDEGTSDQSWSPVSPDAGSTSFPAEGTTEWTMDEQMHFAFFHHDPRFGIIGINEHGNPSEVGPFWHFMSETLLDLLETQATENDKLIYPQDKFEEATRNLQHLSRGRHRELQQHRTDVLEVFASGMLSTLARQSGMQVAEGSQEFTSQTGWTGLPKSERQRLRQALEMCRPRLARIVVPAGDATTRARAGHAVQAALAWEVALRQREEGRHFVVEAHHLSPTWSSSMGQRAREDPENCVLMTQSGDLVLTNDLDLGARLVENGYLEHTKDRQANGHASLLPTPIHSEVLLTSTSSTTSEKFQEVEMEARRLLRDMDFTHRGCLRLLRGVPWDELPIGRRRHAKGLSRERRQTVTFGQFTHGGMTGVTRATRLLPWVCRYVNNYLTRHGGLSGRSSITIGINSHISYHKDVNNIGETDTIAIGKFTGGQLWVEQSGGSVQRQVRPGTWKAGSLKATHHKVTTFSGRDFHGVEPYTGERWSISGYRTRTSSVLAAGDQAVLGQLGFNLHGYERDPQILWSQESVFFEAVREHGRNHNFPERASFPEVVEISEDEEEPVAGERGVPERADPAEAPQTMTAEQKRLVRKIHINTGHPPMARLLRTLRAAGALPHVLEYVKNEFQCDDCGIKKQADARRRAQCPRVFSFNRVLSVDIMYVKFNGTQVPILNMVCTGTNYHVAVRILGASGTPTAKATWKGLAESWIRYLGPPHLIISDGGNEFRGAFERGAEQSGCLQHICAAESPWQNSKSERHGGWLKRRLQQEIDSGRCAFGSLEELDLFLSTLTSTKNRWYNQGGHTPVQLVFGELPRIPGELLGDHPGGLVPLVDAYHDPSGNDEIGEEFRRRNAVRERAKQLAMESSSKEAITKALKTSTSPSRKWTLGQWVYVYRRAKAGDGLHPTSRWVGPGLIIMQGQGIIWVAMRTRLWRCTSEQLRPAFPSEVLGSQLSSDPSLSDLLRKVTANTRAGAVDVAKEGPPPGEAEQCDPVQRIEIEERPIEGGPETGVPLSMRLPPGEVPQGPQPPITIPPGLIGPAPSDPAPGLQPMVAPEHLRASQNSSRRSSVEEPAQEPDGREELPVIPEEPPGLPSASGAAASDSPPSKVARTTESTRAPGTPIQRLLQRVRRDYGPPETSSTQANASESGSREHSRSPRRPEDREDGELWSWFHVGQSGELNLLAKRSDEISLKELTDEERKLFEGSDRLEWEAILKTKAVRVLTGEEAAAVRKKWGDRILSSRMVRRRKPLDQENRWKPKSRWCLGGHTDPDTGSLVTFAPTPQGEGMMAFMQTSLNLGHRFVFSDVKNAFCQSNRLKRPGGPLFAEPCSGLNLPEGAIIAIDIPVYGLDDAPAAWRRTVVEHLTEGMGYVRNLVEPCWFMKFEACKETGETQNVSQILLEVDDFIVTARESHEKEIEAGLKSRFDFGKWQAGSAEYAGRRVRHLGDRVLVDQGKYIREQIRPIALEKSRKQDKKATLNQLEFEALRSAIYKINWVAKESRPEMAGLASIMASRLKVATIDDVLTLNKCVNHLHNTSERSITLWKMDPRELCFVVVTDAGGITTREGEVDEAGLPIDATQGAWAVIATERLPVGRERIRGSILAWRSSKLKRKVYSSFGGEVQAMLQGVNEVDWLQIMIRDAVFHDVELRSWRNSLSPHMLVLRGDCRLHERQQQCSVTDAKSLYDCLLKENPQGRQDRKAALELAIVVKDLQETKSMVRWSPHQKNLVDSLTKLDPLKGNGAMDEFLKQGTLSLVDVKEELENRATDPKFRRRSHAAAVARLIDEHRSDYFGLWSTIIWGNCEALAADLHRHHSEY